MIVLPPVQQPQYDVGDGIAKAVMTFIDAQNRIADQQSRHARDMMQLGMFGQKMQEQQLERAQKQKVLDAFSGVNFSNPAQAQKQLLPLIGLDPQRAGAALSGIANIQQAHRQQEERDMERGALEYLYKKQGMPVPWAKNQEPAGEVPQLVTQHAENIGVDPSVAHRIAQTESGYNQGAISPAGAQGVFQLMPGTAKEMGVNPVVLEENIKGGLGYYKKMLDSFGGNHGLAAMAYNWGPGNVKAYLETGAGVKGQPIPEETKNYVKKVAGIDVEDLMLPGKAGDMAKTLYDAQAKEQELALEREKFEFGKTPQPTYQDVIKENFAAAAAVPEKDRTPEQKEAYQLGVTYGLQKFDKAREQDKTYSSIVLQDIGKAKNIASGKESWLPTVGMGSILSAVPGTKAHDLSSTLTTIKANIGFDRLQKMRAESPTGGALGAVSDSENKMLQSTLGSLEQSQSKEQFMQNLDRLEQTYLDIVHGKGNWQRGVNGDVVIGGGGQSQPQAQPQAFDFSAMSDEELLRGL